MTKKQIIGILEQKFLREHQAMEFAFTAKNNEQATIHLAKSCAFIEILSQIKDLPINVTLDKMIRKYNLD